MLSETKLSFFVELASGWGTSLQARWHRETIFSYMNAKRSSTKVEARCGLCTLMLTTCRSLGLMIYYRNVGGQQKETLAAHRFCWISWTFDGSWRSRTCIFWYERWLMIVHFGNWSWWNVHRLGPRSDWIDSSVNNNTSICCWQLADRREDML